MYQYEALQYMYVCTYVDIPGTRPYNIIHMWIYLYDSSYSWLAELPASAPLKVCTWGIYILNTYIYIKIYIYIESYIYVYIKIYKSMYKDIYIYILHMWIYLYEGSYSWLGLPATAPLKGVYLG